MKISNYYTGICSFCINKELMSVSLYIFFVYYFQLRNEFADKTPEKILRLEKSRKIWKLDNSLHVISLTSLEYAELQWLLSNITELPTCTKINKDDTNYELLH